MTLVGCNEDILGLGNRARRAARASLRKRERETIPRHPITRLAAGIITWLSLQMQPAQRGEWGQLAESCTPLLLFAINNFAFAHVGEDAAELRRI